MKRLFCIFFAAVMLFCGCARTSSAPRSNANPTEPTKPLSDFPVPEISGYADFADVLAAKLLDGTENKNLSPISVYLALALVAEGAAGETKEAMLKLLGCESLEELRGVCGAMLDKLSINDENTTIALADSIWMADDIHFRDDYLKTLADTYRSEANTVNFASEEASKQIGDWITDHTRGKIEISPDALNFDPSTVAALINTIYLKDSWLEGFMEELTAPGAFFGPDGEQTVSYMKRQDTDAQIVQGDGFLRYSLSLRSGRMTFVLPDEGTALSDLLGTPEKLHALFTDGEEIKAKVNMKLPKFEFQDRLDLKKALQELGIEIVFNGDAADFSNMCDRDCYISKVLQESYIDVNEKGVEAAAYTMITMETNAMPHDLPQIDFHLTRPFLYAIESHDGTVLFVGTVTAPTSAN